jgi:hypothetical protein
MNPTSAGIEDPRPSGDFAVAVAGRGLAINPSDQVLGAA